MTQILTIMIDQDEQGRMGVNWVSSGELSVPVALAAVTAVREKMYHQAVEAEVIARLSAEQDELIEADAEEIGKVSPFLEDADA